MAEPNVPVNQGEEPQQPQPMVAPQRPGQGPVVVAPESEERERHTVPPELPYPRYHMADNRDVAGYWDSASFDTRQEIVRRSELRTTNHPLAPEPRKFSDKEVYDIAGTPWKQLTIGIKMELISTVYNYMGYGNEDLGDTVPELDEGQKDELKAMGIMAKLARGGWKRISMNTVQSDDNRFTITQVDPTRRSKWFLLKDMETGESYETTTMTDAKKKAKEIRGDAEAEDVDEYEGHEYCSECGECTTCNLRPCNDGGEHTSGKTKVGALSKSASAFRSKLLRNRRYGR